MPELLHNICMSPADEKKTSMKISALIIFDTERVTDHFKLRFVNKESSLISITTGHVSTTQ